MAIRPWSSTMRATRPSCQVARRHGRGTRPPGRSCDGRDAAGARDPPLPRSPRRPSLASCRCRCRRPRTVCVVPRERWAALAAFRASGRDPGTATRCRPPGLPPSDGDAVVAGLAAGAKRVIGQGHGDDRIGRMAVPEQTIDPAVLVLSIEGLEPRQVFRTLPIRAACSKTRFLRRMSR